MNFILIAVLVLGAIALIAALVLFGVSKKFAVEEDPRLGQVGELLPGANCGGCGFAGCSGMASHCTFCSTERDTLSSSMASAV